MCKFELSRERIRSYLEHSEDPSIKTNSHSTASEAETAYIVKVPWYSSDEGKRRAYSDDFREEVAEYSLFHTKEQTCSKYDVRTWDILRWRKRLLNTNGNFRLRVPKEKQREIVRYSLLSTSPETCVKFNVRPSDLKTWKNKFIQDLSKCVDEEGEESAAITFKLDLQIISTLMEENELKKSKREESLHNEWDKDKKMEVLKEAEEIGVKTASKKHNIPSTTVSYWRNRYTPDVVKRKSRPLRDLEEIQDIIKIAKTEGVKAAVKKGRCSRGSLYVWANKLGPQFIQQQPSLRRDNVVFRHKSRRIVKKPKPLKKIKVQKKKPVEPSPFEVPSWVSDWININRVPPEKLSLLLDPETGILSRKPKEDSPVININSTEELSVILNSDKESESLSCEADSGYESTAVEQVITLNLPVTRYFTERSGDDLEESNGDLLSLPFYSPNFPPTVMSTVDPPCVSACWEEDTSSDWEEDTSYDLEFTDESLDPS